MAKAQKQPLLVYVRDQFSGGLGDPDPEDPPPGQSELVDFNLYKAYQQLLAHQDGLEQELKGLKHQNNSTLEQTIETKQRHFDLINKNILFCYGDLATEPQLKSYYDSLRLYDYHLPFLLLIDLEHETPYHYPADKPFEPGITNLVLNDSQITDFVL